MPVAPALPQIFMLIDLHYTMTVWLLAGIKSSHCKGFYRNASVSFWQLGVDIEQEQGMSNHTWQL